MITTPNSERIHIVIFGKTNAGKSTLINAITEQKVSLVSEKKGTTTDAVSKAMEIPNLGAVLFIDTAGIDDASELGKERVAITERTLKKADFAILVVDSEQIDDEREYLSSLQKFDTPFLIVKNVKDSGEKTAYKVSCTDLGEIVSVNLKSKKDVYMLKDKLAQTIQVEKQMPLTAGLVKKDDVVILVMPQDISAPKGRLILPQVMAIRDVMEQNATAICVKTTELGGILNMLKTPPNLIITDSKEFDFVREFAKDIPLTSFSILLANEKGDLKEFVKGVKAIESLRENDKVLIMEACTHHTQKGDIARERIPLALQKKLGFNLDFEFFAGAQIPEKISDYKLIIHCGGCMINRKNMLSRIRMVKEKNIPITNFGVVFAYLGGILEKATEIVLEK